MTKAFLTALVAAALVLTPCCAGAEEAGTQDAPLEINWSTDTLSRDTEADSSASESASAASASEDPAAPDTQSDQGEQADSQAEDAAADAADHFVFFDDIGMRMYLVPGFEEMEISEEDREMGYLAYYEKEDLSAAVGVMLVNADGTDTRSYKESLRQLGVVSDITDVIVNGRRGVRFRIEDEQALYVGFPTQAGYIIEFSFAPVDDESFAADAELMLSSILSE